MATCFIFVVLPGQYINNMMSVLGPLVLLYLISVTAAGALLCGGPKNSPIARSGARPLKPRIYELHRLSADGKRIDSARIGRQLADSRPTVGRYFARFRICFCRPMEKNNYPVIVFHLLTVCRFWQSSFKLGRLSGDHGLIIVR